MATALCFGCQSTPQQSLDATGDGDTNVADALAAPDAPRPDVVLVDVRVPDAFLQDSLPADAVAVDVATEASTDTNSTGDGSLSDTATNACKTHTDCAQGAYCYYGVCNNDPALKIYHCNKPGCPPGHRRVLGIFGEGGLCRRIDHFEIRRKILEGRATKATLPAFRRDPLCGIPGDLG